MTSLAADLMEQIRGAKLVVFDFDGTLVDSNAIKWQAFARCFDEFPGQLERIMDYCGGYNHTPRWEKFQYVYERILGLSYTTEVADRLHARFEAATTQQIIEAPEIPGAGAWLRRVSQRCETALLSSTPQETLVHIVTARGWADCFQEIRGAPVDKAHWLRTAHRRHALRPQELVYLGDCREDHAAAEQAGCVFIAVGDRWTGAPLRIPDFTSLVG